MTLSTAKKKDRLTETETKFFIRKKARVVPGGTHKLLIKLSQ